MNTTYSSAETSGDGTQRILDSLMSWFAREATTTLVTIIIVVMLVLFVSKMIKNAARGARDRAKELANEKLDRLRHEQAMAERERSAALVKDKLRRVREKNKLKASASNNVTIPRLTLNDLTNPKSEGHNLIPRFSLDDLIDTTKVEGMKEVTDAQRQRKKEQIAKGIAKETAEIEL
ncbi:MAG: hypothetical protein H9W81_13965 [Enterococcus sp.]|nr:hypothetical protein [Enterococcus sp.]